MKASNVGKLMIFFLTVHILSFPTLPSPVGISTGARKIVSHNEGSFSVSEPS